MIDWKSILSLGMGGFPFTYILRFPPSKNIKIPDIGIRRHATVGMDFHIRCIYRFDKGLTRLPHSGMTRASVSLASAFG
jgi:hypothetical protein